MGKKDIPFSYVDPNSGDEVPVTPSTKPSESEIGFRPWFARPRTYFTAAATALALGLSTLGFLKNSPTPEATPDYSYTVPETLLQDTTPEITSFIIGKDTVAINEKDKFVRDLSGQTDFVNYTTGAMVDSSFFASSDLFSNLSFEHLMDATNFSEKSLYNCYTHQGDLNFPEAIKTLWAIKKDGRLSKEFFDDADKLVDSYSPSKSSLESYYAYLGDELATFKKDFDLSAMLQTYGTSNFDVQKKRAVENLFENLNEDVVLSYQMTELFPEINPVFNYVFMDKLLQEAGEDFLVRIPALHDPYMSFGPFQLTSKVIYGDKGATAYNKFLPDGKKAPGSMIYYDTLDEHVKGAVLNMVGNTEYFAKLLGIRGQLTKFNDFYESLPESEQALVATAMYSVMHNNPGRAATGFANYLKSDETPTYAEFANEVDFGLSQPYLRKSLRNKLVLERLLEE